MLSTSCQTQAVSLPVTRRLTRYRLALADLALEMLEQVCTEEMKQARLWERKGSIERTIEEFVRMTPDLTAVQQVKFYAGLKYSVWW